jgi:hypothetical protein
MSLQKAFRDITRVKVNQEDQDQESDSDSDGSSETKKESLAPPVTPLLPIIEADLDSLFPRKPNDKGYRKVPRKFICPYPVNKFLL